MFESADRDGKGHVSVLDFQVILTSNKSKWYDMRDLEYLLRLYDKQGTRKIQF